jgi:hypothetical protein
LLVRVLNDAGNTWHEAIEDGEEWDRAPVPFHVILFAKAMHSPTVLANWNSAGAGIGLP